MSSTWTFVLLIPGWLFVSASLVSGPAQRPAEPEVRRFAVFERSEETAAKPPPDDCLKGFTRRSHPLYDRYRLLILQANSNDAPPTRAVSMCLGSGWIEVPFVYEDEALAVPTDEILLRFKPDVHAAAIAALLKAQHLSTNDEKPESGTIKAKTHRPKSESADIAKKLQASGFVEYAEPNKLLVRFGG